MKRSSLYTLSAIIGIVFLTMIVVPYFFHDFKLTLDRSSYVEKENRNFSTIIFDEKTIKKLDLEDVFDKVDMAYESTKACYEPNDHYGNGCRIEQNVKAYHAYNIIEELDFTSYPRSPGHYAVAIEGHDKLYFVYLDSINWIQYMTVATIFAIPSVLLSVWLYLRHEKHLIRTQNHGIGITLGVLVGSVGFLVLQSIFQIGDPVAIFFVFHYHMLLVGAPFIVTYALWYYEVGNKFVNNEKLQESIE